MKNLKTANLVNVRLDEIKVEIGIQLRAKLNSDVIAEYAQRMQSGDEFPPVLAYQECPGKPYLLADGFHRIEATRKAAMDTLKVEVRQGDRRQALHAALTANLKHGLRMTNADKRQAVTLALNILPEQSNRKLAELCGVDKEMVETVRKQVADSATCLSAKRMGRDGKKYAPRSKIPAVENSFTTNRSPTVQMAISIPVSQSLISAPDLAGAIPVRLLELNGMRDSLRNWENFVRSEIQTNPPLRLEFRNGLISVITWLDSLPTAQHALPASPIISDHKKQPLQPKI